MSSKNCDKCIVCSKTIRTCHKNIYCKICKCFTHKKCTNLKQKQLKCLNPNEWVCKKCEHNQQDAFDTDPDTSLDNLNNTTIFNVADVDLDQYDNMIFNPLRFENNSNNKVYNDISSNNNLHKCSYITPDQFSNDRERKHGQIIFLMSI